MYLSRDVKFTPCYLFIFSRKTPQYYDVTAWGKKKGVRLSSHKTTVPMSSLLLVGSVLCVKDSERNELKLSCVLSWLCWKPPVLAGDWRKAEGQGWP